MSDTTQKRLRALALFSAPVVLMVGWLLREPDGNHRRAAQIT